MPWIVRIKNGYVLTPIQWALASWLWSGFMIFNLLRLTMFEHVANELPWLIGIAGTAMMCWMLLIQFTRFKENYYRDIGTEKQEMSSKFSYVPYILIPLAFMVLCGSVAMLAVDIAVGRGYLIGNEEICAAYTALTFVLYLCCDWRLISRIGDIVYLHSLEKKAVEKVEKTAKEASGKVIKFSVNGKDIECSEELALQLLGKS